MKLLSEKLNKTFKKWLAQVLEPTGHTKVAFTGNPNEYDDNNYFAVIEKIYFPNGPLNWYSWEDKCLVNTALEDVDEDYTPTPEEKKAFKVLSANLHSIVDFVDVDECYLGVVTL